MRSTPELDRQLQRRFAEAVEKATEGNADGFGRMLGYTNGGYVREILRGVKPVREAIIERVHGLAGFADWFTPLLPAVVARDVGIGADSFGPRFSLPAIELAKAFDAAPEGVKRRLYAILLDEIRRAAAPALPSHLPDSAPNAPRHLDRQTAPAGRRREP